MRKLFFSMFFLGSFLLVNAQVYQWEGTNIQYGLGTGLTVNVSNGVEVQTSGPGNAFTYRIFIWNDPDFRDPAEIAQKIFESTPGEDHAQTNTGYNYAVQQSGLENQKVAGTVVYNGNNVKSIVYAYKDPDADQILVAQYIYTMGIQDDQYENHAESLFGSFRKVQ